MPDSRLLAAAAFVLVFSLQLANGLAVVPEITRPALEVAIAVCGCICLAVLAFRARRRGAAGASPLAAFFPALGPAAVGLIWAGAYLLWLAATQRLEWLPFAAYRTWQQLDWFRMHANGMVVVAVWIVMAMLPAVLEETTYKPVLLRALGTGAPKWSFVLASGVLFGSVHIEQGVLAASFIALSLGVPSAAFYWQSRALAPLVILHFIADLSVGPLPRSTQGGLP